VVALSASTDSALTVPNKDIGDAQAYEIAASQLAVDGHVEKREIICDD